MQRRPSAGNGLARVVPIIDPDGYRMEFTSPTDAPENTEFESSWFTKSRLLPDYRRSLVTCNCLFRTLCNLDPYNALTGFLPESRRAITDSIPLGSKTAYRLMVTRDGGG